MITHPFTGDIKTDVKSVLYANNKTKTYDHVKAVAEMNVKIGGLYGLDKDICELCGYLHDISAVVSHTDMMDYAIRNGWHIDESERKFPMLLHQRIARVIAQEDFGVTDERILSAVEHHTTLKANPSVYDMAVFIADKLAWDQCEIHGEAPFYTVVNNALKHSLEAACLAYQDYIVAHKIILHPHKWFEESVQWLKDLRKSMNHKGTITLETERLVLRRLTINDTEAMFRNWASDREVTKYLTWPTHTDVSVSESIVNSWIPLYDKPDYYHWTIVLKELGEPIGTIAAVEQRDDIKMVHIGYCIGRKWWNKGITSEALREIIRFFFEEVGVNRIESRYDPRNPNSGKVMLKCGLKYEGTMRQSDANNQGICDAVYYVLLADEYYTNKTKNQKAIIYQPYTPAHLDGILRLSQDWFHENITFGIVPDAAEDVASYENEYFHVALSGECSVHLPSANAPSAADIFPLQVVGYVTAEIVEENEYNIFPRGANYLRVNDLYIDMNYRGHGIGEELLALVEQKADENNVQHIFISSATKDADAVRRFYQRNGYGVWATSFYKRKGWDVRVYPLGDLCGYRYTVTFARYKDKWLYCRAKERDTFETAGGRIEKGESLLEAAKREFYEETGAVRFDIKPVFDYAVYREDDFANGQVFFAEVYELGDMPGFEMAEVKLFDTIPEKMRFPQILPVLFEKVRDMACN